MPRTNILLGQLGGDTIWRFNEGASDGGTAIAVLAQSAWTPETPGHVDYVYHNVYLTVTWTMTVTLQVSAQVDADPDTETVNGWDFAPLGNALALVGAATPQTQTFQVPMYVTMSRGGSEVGRNALRGRRARVKVESVGGLAAGLLSIDGVGLDMEPVEDTIAQEGP